jgi:PadR family transcriptional regulator, regulatory protein PadR
MAGRPHSSFKARAAPFDIQHKLVQTLLYRYWEHEMGDDKSEVLQGTLDLMVLKILETMGPLHGYGIARRIEQLSDNSLSMNQGTIYPALVRLQLRKWIKADWGTTEKNRTAKYYSLTKAGVRQLTTETQSWQRVVATMARCLAESR